jgi:nicotinamidase-related amidase
MTSKTSESQNHCGLCGKSKEQVRKLIVGLHSAVCSDCVDLCNDILRNDPQHRPRTVAKIRSRLEAARRDATDGDILIVVDLQAPFLDHIHERERVVRRARFLIEVARELEMPIIATEQAPERLGRTEESVRTALGATEIYQKTEFSAGANEQVLERLAGMEQRSCVIVGVETHICVCGTALDLLAAGYGVTVCPDATSSRSLEAHKLGMERVRDAGAMPAHTESIAYEWMGSSTHPKFRDVLEIVKRYPL